LWLDVPIDDVVAVAAAVASSSEEINLKFISIFFVHPNIIKFVWTSAS
jgi:hypothetical protein